MTKVTRTINSYVIQFLTTTKRCVTTQKKVKDSAELNGELDAYLRELELLISHIWSSL